MRRTNAIVVTVLCATIGCRGSEAQEPYDGVMATGPAASIRVATQIAQAADTIVMASEVDVPWAIALLSDGKASAVKRPKRVVVAQRAQRARRVTKPATAAASLEVVFGQPHDHADEKPAAAPDAKPAAPKACGVVNRRS